MDFVADNYRVVIVGGGPCGLGAAIRFSERNYSDWVLLEAENNLGGLSSSFVDTQGYTWDQGGHVGFSHYEYYDRVVDRSGSERVQYERRCKLVWRNGDNLVDYPVQLHTHQLPADLRNFEAAPDAAAIRNKDSFAYWVVQKFGWNLYYVFFRPYNIKVWTYPLEEMSHQWVKERVAEKPKGPTQESAETIPASAWGPNAKMMYPLRGGTGALWDKIGALLDQTNVKLSTRVEKIKVKSKIVKHACSATKSSKSVGYDFIISSMPLPKLCSILDAEDDKELEKVIDRLATLSNQLKYSHTYIIGLGIVEQTDENKKFHDDGITNEFHWAYFPETDVPFYRCTVLSNLSPHMCPDRKDGRRRKSLLFEVARRPAHWGGGAFEERVSEDLVDAVIAAAQRNRLIGGSWGVESVWTKTIMYGYPTPSLERDDIVHEVVSVLEAKFGIISKGRFGLWKYEISNMDHCFMQGVEAACDILDDHFDIRNGTISL